MSLLVGGAVLASAVGASACGEGVASKAEELRRETALLRLRLPRGGLLSAQACSSWAGAGARGAAPSSARSEAHQGAAASSACAAASASAQEME